VAGRTGAITSAADSLQVRLFGRGAHGSMPQAKEEGHLNNLPVNHSPLFAPVIHPTLETGVETLVVAAQAWLSAQQNVH
jgi:hypothetical protein